MVPPKKATLFFKFFQPQSAIAFSVSRELGFNFSI